MAVALQLLPQSPARKRQPTAAEQHMVVWKLRHQDTVDRHLHQVVTKINRRLAVSGVVALTRLLARTRHRVGIRRHRARTVRRRLEVGMGRDMIRVADPGTDYLGLELDVGYGLDMAHGMHIGKAAP